MHKHSLSENSSRVEERLVVLALAEISDNLRHDLSAELSDDLSHNSSDMN